MSCEFESHSLHHFCLRQLATSREQREVHLSLPRRESQSRIFAENAAIAQLVEHDLAKVGVASSSLVCRSILKIITKQLVTKT